MKQSWPNKSSTEAFLWERLSKITKNLSHGSRCPDSDSRRAPTKYKSRTLLVHFHSLPGNMLFNTAFVTGRATVPFCCVRDVNLWRKKYRRVILGNISGTKSEAMHAQIHHPENVLTSLEQWEGVTLCWKKIRLNENFSEQWTEHA